MCWKNGRIARINKWEKKTIRNGMLLLYLENRNSPFYYCAFASITSIFWSLSKQKKLKYFMNPLKAWRGTDRARPCVGIKKALLGDEAFLLIFSFYLVIFYFSINIQFSLFFLSFYYRLRLKYTKNLNSIWLQIPIS